MEVISDSDNESEDDGEDLLAFASKKLTISKTKRIRRFVAYFLD